MKYIYVSNLYFLKNILSISGNYPPGVDKASQRNPNSLNDEMVQYLISCYARVHSEESDHKKRSSASPLFEALTASRTQVINYTSLTIQGVFDPDTPVPKLPHSPIHKQVAEGTLPPKFIFDLVETTTTASWAEFKAVFMPLIQSLVRDGRYSSIVNATYRPSLSALVDLCEIKVGGKNMRPICQLLTEIVSFHFCFVTKSEVIITLFL